MTIKKRRKCLLCGGTRYTPIVRSLKANIYECKKCSLAYTESKKVSKKELYKRSGLYNFKHYEKNERLHEKKFEEIILILRNFIKKGRVLEVGAGFGLFSSLLEQDRRFQTHAIEPNLKTAYLNQARSKTRTYKLTYEQFLRKNKLKFDVVIFLDVLEHFKNPKKILEVTKKILSKKGLVVILLPNYKSLMARMSKHWPWWMVEDHRYHFTMRSMKLLLSKIRYDILYLTSFESIYDFKKSLDGNFTDVGDDIERKLRKVFFYSLFFPLYLVFRRIIWSLGQGGLICVVAQKKERRYN